MASFRFAALLSLWMAMSVCGNVDLALADEKQANDATVLAANTKGHSSANESSADKVEARQASGWRRTETGWVHTDDWTTSSSSTGETRATKLHPGLIAAFVVLVSIGGLLAFEPLFNLRRKRLVKSDEVLIKNWGDRLRRSNDSYDCL